jgi:hypothetical protein
MQIASNRGRGEHEQFLQVVHKGRHVIAATIVGVEIGFARYMMRKLIQHTLKHTSNGAGANTINISCRAFKVRAVILNDVRFSSS